MTDRPLGEYLWDAFQEYVNDHQGGGFPTGFISVFEWMDSEGNFRVSVSAPEPNRQPTPRSIGMATFADEWFRDDIRAEIGAAIQLAYEDQEGDEADGLGEN
jgi:hypothetical protein